MQTICDRILIIAGGKLIAFDKPENLEKSMSILNMIISLSKTLGLSVVTEGVETKEQVVKLTRMGCGVYQGYYFSKPIPVEEFEKRYM